MTRINTAVVGWGLSASVFHIPFVLASDRFNFYALGTSQGDRAGKQFPGLKLYSDYQQLLADDRVDLVIITTPNNRHYPMARAALEQGKHVIVDKPFVTRSRDGKELIDLARAKQRVLSVFHNRRWDGDFLTLRYLIDSGTIGEVRSLASHFDRFRPQPRKRWREQAGEGTGIWFDLGPHLLDQVLFLFGRPEALSARLATLRSGGEVTDYFHVQLHYPDREVLLHSSPFRAGPNPRFQLEGTRGTFLKMGLDPQEDRLRQGSKPDNEDWAAELAESYGTLYREDGQETIKTITGGYQHYFTGVAEAIEQEIQPPVTAGEALDVIRLLELAERSHAMGQTLDILFD